MKQLLPLAALALVACTTTADPRPLTVSPIRSDGLTGLGQPTRVGRLAITPEALVEDSRCPINARCIWAGRVLLRTRIDGAGWSETVTLALGQPVETHGNRVTLIAVKPDTMAGVAVALKDYRFDFEASVSAAPN